MILRCLHGFGDAVQSLRYAPMLRAMAAGLIVEVPLAMLEIASGFDGVDEVITWGERASTIAPDWDVQIEVVELPYIFRTQQEDLPLATNGYLESVAELTRIEKDGSAAKYTDPAGQIHPLTGEPRRRNGHARPELFELRAKEAAPRRRNMEARYDAARDTSETATTTSQTERLSTASLLRKGPDVRQVVRA